MTPIFCVSGENHGLSTITLPKLKRGPFNFLKLAIDCSFQKVNFSLYIEISRE